MLKHLQTLIQSSPAKTVQTAELETQLRLEFPAPYQEGGYLGFAAAMEKLCLQQIISPVKASGKNGRNPGLYNSYRRVEHKLDQTALDELLTFHPDLSIDYYRTRPAGFMDDFPYLSALNKFLFSGSDLTIPYSLNERSFQIFRDEKFLASTAGRAFLQHIGFDFSRLNCYQTFEPFFYSQYLRQEDNFANLLIVENKDTFFSLKKCFSEERRQIGGISFNFLLYGEGRKIVTSFGFYREVQGLHGKTPRAYYFGDLDPEGIDIFGQLQENFPEIKIEPFTYLYQALLERHPEWPKARHQNQKLKPERLGLFLSNFPPDQAAQIQSRLEDKLYLPQEGLNYAYFSREVK